MYGVIGFVLLVPPSLGDAKISHGINKPNRTPVSDFATTMLNDLKRARVANVNPSIKKEKELQDLGVVFPLSLLLLRLIGVFSVSPTRLISRSTGAHC
jgi:hypothetical protein